MNYETLQNQSSQVPHSKPTEHQAYIAAELRSIRLSRHSPNIRASTATWLTAHENKEYYLEGSFENVQYENCKFWCFGFGSLECQNNTDIADLTGSRISFLDICPEGELILVKMIVGTNSDTREILFRCREVNVNYYRYQGMSYRNLYDTEDYQKAIDKQRYVLDKEYFIRKEEISLPDEYSIETTLYNDSTQYALKARLRKCILKNSTKQSTNTCALMIMV